MSATMNGPARRPQLSDQIGRLEDLLGRLDEDLPDAVGEAVRDALASLVPALAEAVAARLARRADLDAGQGYPDHGDHARRPAAPPRAAQGLPVAAAAVARAAAEGLGRAVAAGAAVAAGVAHTRRLAGVALTSARWWLAATRAEQMRGLAATAVGFGAAALAVFSGPTIATAAAALGVAGTCWAGLAAAGWPGRRG